jgi:hypothetical protein
VALEERLSLSQQPPSPGRSLEKPATAVATQKVAEVVADDRGDSTDEDHERKRQVVLRSENGCRNQAGLTGNRKSG